MYGSTTRREFLRAAVLSAVAVGCGGTSGSGRGDPPDPPDLPGAPFRLGVASGDPTPRSAILWTRLAPQPLAGGGMPDRRVPVIWEVARSNSFDEIVSSGWTFAQPRTAHSIHVDPGDLEPATTYFYRFRVGDQWQSPVGRTRTLPAPDASPERLRLGLCCCQDWRDGEYNAHSKMAEEELDAAVFVGDYIYEDGDGAKIREHPGPEVTTLREYRNRHALYKTDERLRNAHRRFPWICTWDDHEVDGNYAGARQNERGGEVLERRAAAYRAYYEHMPIRISFDRSTAEDTLIYRQFQFGDLASLWMLDGRQYRTAQPCDGEVGEACDAVTDPENTMLGSTQKGWLKEGLAASETTWNLLGNQTVFAPATFGGSLANPDQWDGYQAERQELLDFVREESVDNFTVLSGDLHAAGFSTLHANDDDPSSPTVGHEILATSLSSGTGEGNLSDVEGDTVENLLENVHHFNIEDRGYSIVEYTPDRCRVVYRTVSRVDRPGAEISDDAIFEIPAGGGEFEAVET